MTSYYNEIDPYAAAWLRNLIAAGHIAPGEVDERSIVDVKPGDLRGFGQCHFFAGIGGWSYAIRLAGIQDDRPIWSGSCPCQPFSVAGAQRGSEDERHLWPAFFNLIRECRPATVVGEQVAGAAGVAWYDHVAADLEGAGYAVAAANLGAHSVGAPHIRQWLYWVAHSNETGFREQRIGQLFNGERAEQRDDIDGRGADGSMADMQSRGCGQGSPDTSRGDEGTRSQGAWLRPSDDGCIDIGNANNTGPQGRIAYAKRTGELAARPAGLDCWSDIEWIKCSDGKYRPVGAGIFPLAARLPKGVVRGGDRSMAPDANDSSEARVMRLRGYGNAIVPQLAAAFMRAAF